QNRRSFPPTRARQRADRGSSSAQAPPPRNPHRPLHRRPRAIRHHAPQRIRQRRPPVPPGNRARTNLPNGFPLRLPLRYHQPHALKRVRPSATRSVVLYGPPSAADRLAETSIGSAGAFFTLSFEGRRAASLFSCHPERSEGSWLDCQRFSIDETSAD